MKSSAFSSFPETKKLSRVEKIARLDKIREEILAQKICPELAAQAKNLVMGEGDPHAKILFIGEAPGKNEDEQGRPFVGAAGKFLDEMLARAKISRKDVFITNIVKYRPPNNRDPLPEEKAAFWPFLLQQIKIIAPELVVSLGRHAMEQFLPGEKISRIHGQPRRITLDFAGENFSWTILPLYHPAAALYNGAMREVLLDDFARVPEILNQIKKREIRENVLKIMNES